jgi:5-methyltetrahydrofolate--homocysteine methyltransferase
LELLGARGIVNSVSFEDGDGPDSRFARTMALVKEHGAAVVALTIDERGQARTAADKVAVASRLIDKLTGDWGLRREDIIVDALTFPIATGQAETRRDGVETLNAIQEIKRRYPGVHTTLGISNISFGLPPAAREVLNAVFLHEAQAAGLDTAIINPAKLLPFDEIPVPRRKAALDLIYDRTPAVILRGAEGVVAESSPRQSNALAHFLSLFPSRSVSTGRANRLTPPDGVGARLTARIVDGNRDGLEADLTAAISDGIAPLSIVNEYLLPAMAIVGERMSSGQTYLPFVLQSAEVMKATIDWLQPYLSTDRNGNGDGNPDAIAARGTIVLATVRGDVHDIGKNLVDIILSNNGYRVINLGIKQSIDAIIEAAIEHDADVIGMSGLLVKSTQVMRENLAELTARGLANRWPVILGGAALNRRFVCDQLQPEFPGIVRYAKDAFEGLALMQELVQ